MPERPAVPTGISPRGVLLTLAAIVCSGAVVWLVGPLHEAAAFALRGDTTGLKDQLRELGAWGILVLLSLMLAHAVLPYPAEIPTAAAGFVYGFVVAVPIVVAGWLLSALLTYAMGRYAGRTLLYRIAGRRRFLRAERAVIRGGVPVLLAARLVPVVPFSLTGYVAGAARVPLGRFAWTTVVGFLPLTLVFVLLGSRLDELSLADPLLYAALAPFAALLLLAKPLLARMRAHEDGADGVDGESSQNNHGMVSGGSHEPAALQGHCPSEVLVPVDRSSHDVTPGQPRRPALPLDGV